MACGGADRLGPQHGRPPLTLHTEPLAEVRVLDGKPGSPIRSTALGHISPSVARPSPPASSELQVQRCKARTPREATHTSRTSKGNGVAPPVDAADGDDGGDPAVGSGWLEPITTNPDARAIYL